MNEFNAVVHEMLRDFGTEFLLVQGKSGEYDPALGQVTMTERMVKVRGILLDFTLQNNGLTTKLGTEILAGDKQFFMQPPEKSGGIPVSIDVVNDYVKVGKLRYKIITVKEVNPTGASPVLYELVLRR